MLCLSNNNKKSYRGKPETKFWYTKNENNIFSTISTIELPAPGISSMLLETSPPESHLDNSAVCNCSEDYLEGNECSLSLPVSGCGSFDNDCAVSSGTYTEFVNRAAMGRARFIIYLWFIFHCFVSDQTHDLHSAVLKVAVSHATCEGC